MARTIRLENLHPSAFPPQQLAFEAPDWPQRRRPVRSTTHHHTEWAFTLECARQVGVGGVYGWAGVWGCVERGGGVKQ